MRITIASIKTAVAARYGIAEADLVSPARRWDISHPRQVAMALARHLTCASFPQIGRAFGGRHHSTAIYADRQIALRMATSKYLRVNIEALLRELIG